MFSVPRLLLLLLLLEISTSLRKISRHNALRVRQEWSDVVADLPELQLQTVLLDQEVCVRVRLSIRPLLSNETLEIIFNNSEMETLDTLTIRRKNTLLLWNSSAGDQFFQPYRTKLQMNEASAESQQAFWILRYNCFSAQSGSVVSVSAHRNDQPLITASHTVQHTAKPEEPVPEARITVDEQEKRFSLLMKTQQITKISLCYKHSSAECVEIKHHGQVDPQERPTLNLSFPHLVPCVCVQLWFTGTDVKRKTECPLKDRILPHGGDVLSSSSVELYGSVLLWKPLCPSDQSDPSISLCWRINAQDPHCVPAPNGTLQGSNLEYDVSAVDKHPQMCVQVSLNSSRRLFCPFQSEGRSEWSVMLVSGSLHLHLQLKTNTDANFSAQLCHRDGDMCASIGPVVSRTVTGGAVESQISVSLPFLSSGLCVQVWRVDLHGRRIICPDLVHRRWGLLLGSAVVLLLLMFCVTLHLLDRSSSALRGSERRPLLLVCSSSDAQHVSAVCSLASGLQGELCMDVRLAQWAQCCQRSSLAQLGPVPWLYGQTQSVQRAGGLVLIVWSPEAQQEYHRWRRNSAEEKKPAEATSITAPEASSITAPVFRAALSCLWTGIHSDGRGRGFGLVCFQTLDSNSCIPKPLRCVPKFCLPKDLPGLIHQLSAAGDGARRCWTRLLSKVLSFSASRKLAPRLEAALSVRDPLIPQTPQGRVRRANTRRKHRRRSRAGSVCSCQKQSSESNPAPHLTP
ncbi:interleukin-17 receptor E isoform X1 [Danio rerio]|uniref:Interleukin-17 receptor E isoform X1 n=3 Tax=Danio rerio TaxID=7955 RepID=A0AC58GCJ7_DANRE